MITPRYLIAGTVVLAIINGIMSPFLLSVFVLYPLWYPNWAPVDQTAVVTLSSLILSSVMLMVTGVPGALYERLTGKQQTDVISAAIWLGCMIVATLPTVPALSMALSGGGAGTG
jgi:hypothetical protein